ncbi:hypothetical protein BDV11DRAFT_24379 [Aspergillus similis]
MSIEEFSRPLICTARIAEQRQAILTHWWILEKEISQATNMFHNHEGLFRGSSAVLTTAAFLAIAAFFPVPSNCRTRHRDMDSHREGTLYRGPGGTTDRLMRRLLVGLPSWAIYPVAAKTGAASGFVLL